MDISKLVAGLDDGGKWEDEYLDGLMIEDKSLQWNFPHGVAWPGGRKGLFTAPGGAGDSKQWRATITLGKQRSLGCSDLYRASLFRDCAQCFFGKVDLPALLKLVKEDETGDASLWKPFLNHHPVVVNITLNGSGDRSDNMKKWFEALRNCLTDGGIYYINGDGKIKKRREDQSSIKVISVIKADVLPLLESMNKDLGVLRGEHRAIDRIAGELGLIREQIVEARARAAKDRDSYAKLFQALQANQQKLSDRMQALTAAVVDLVHQ